MYVCMHVYVCVCVRVCACLYMSVYVCNTYACPYFRSVYAFFLFRFRFPFLLYSFLLPLYVFPYPFLLLFCEYIRLYLCQKMELTIIIPLISSHTISSFIFQSLFFHLSFSLLQFINILLSFFLSFINELSTSQFISSPFLFLFFFFFFFFFSSYSRSRSLYNLAEMKILLPQRYAPKAFAITIPSIDHRRNSR